MDYAELQVTSNYSFLRGASHPEELVLQAATLGHTAIAITDRNTLAGVVRAHVASKLHGIQLIIGARLDLRDASSLICLPTNRAAYGRLSQLLTLGKRRTNKGACHLFLEDILSGELFKGGKGQIIIALTPKTTLNHSFINHYRLPPACISNLKVPSFQLVLTAVLDILRAIALPLARVSTFVVVGVNVNGPNGELAAASLG